MMTITTVQFFWIFTLSLSLLLNLCISTEGGQQANETCSDRNKEFKECGSSCPQSCDDLYLSDVSCALRCSRGCFCRRGYILENRDPSSRCVRRRQCPSRYKNVVKDEDPYYIRCPHDWNKLWQFCGPQSSCVKTCQNPQPHCSSQKCHRGCFCRSGLVFSDNSSWYSGRCMSESQCAAPPPSSETVGKVGQVPCQHASDSWRICLNHTGARGRLAQENISISSPCSDRRREECTSLEGIQEKAVKDLIDLARSSHCQIEIVNGTEVSDRRGRSLGQYGVDRYTPQNGWRLDIRKNRCIDRYIKRQLRGKGSHYCEGNWAHGSRSAYHEEDGLWAINFAPTEC